MFDLPSEPIDPFWGRGNLHGYVATARLVGSDLGTAIVENPDGTIWTVGPERIDAASLRQLVAIDPDAMADANAFWAACAEQMRDGLL